MHAHKSRTPASGTGGSLQICAPLLRLFANRPGSGKGGCGQIERVSEQEGASDRAREVW